LDIFQIMEVNVLVHHLIVNHMDYHLNMVMSLVLVIDIVQVQYFLQEMVENWKKLMLV
jgi:hypothetical protein